MLRSFLVLFICCVTQTVTNDYPVCGPNEVNKCVGCPSEDSCYDRDQILCPAAFLDCTPACVCKEGFIRKTLDRECIPINECGAPCDTFEEYTECKQCRNDTCSSIVNPVICGGEETCTPGCACWDGYYRADENSPCLYRCLCSEAEDCSSR